MTGRKLSSFIEALSAGRRPKPFHADPDDVELLRTAIALRAARPGEATPDEDFVAQLHQKLTDQVETPATSNIYPLKMRRTRAALVAVAASVALVGGTVAATESFNRAPVNSVATAMPRGNDLRTGTFETADGRALGQIVAYRGKPSWVYMNVGLAESNGTVKCRLQLDNGSIVAAGNIQLHNGMGDLSKSIGVDIGRLRGANLYTSTGVRLATATFA
jgi:hypothetical protein